ncbi:uncharacterized protein LOC123694744 [Colias croceus]|uniref:uncharacterized protein LOC123694744 n=1 Tax=Colias crocea TaxID=72248 RepID=UPI001E2809A5|nr:uncharacterized protein LOC123694744 [Colias croceus]XP_045496253.1 uncharacterized protein LOC123694744 [Colias croceus]XP_045496254.1 uncharacterized protein LOC123694744 [Colias croceus]
MVFSQTSHKTRSHLKVVEIDRLKSEKNQQVNGPYGVVTDLRTESASSSPVPTTSSYSEEFLKPEPVFQSTMFHDSDAEFFQDLIQWCDAPTEQVVVQSIDPAKTTQTRAHNTDTLHTQFSPQGWDVFDANSPITQAGLYNPTPPSYPVSPNADGLAAFNTDLFGPVGFVGEDKVVPFQEQFLDIDKLPVVIGELASETVADANPWQTTSETVWHTTHDTSYTKPHTNIHNTMPFIDQEDSLDMKFMSVIPREVERNDVVISEYVINDVQEMAGGRGAGRRAAPLAVDVARQPWPADVISTPEVLTFVEQLEKEKCPLMASTPISPPEHDASPSCSIVDNSPVVEYEPITPKSEPQPDSEEDNKSNASKRRRRDSEESDETYSPYAEQAPRKYKRRKPSIPIKDMIRALEGSQQLTKARRGRPPKRRDSTVSNVSENSSSVSTHETKYRELRDKNNEASKRSRMNRKLKELQMEQLAEELEERNKKLRVQADLLEERTKQLREAFMAAVAQHKVG